MPAKSKALRQRAGDDLDGLRLAVANDLGGLRHAQFRLLDELLQLPRIVDLVAGELENPVVLAKSGLGGGGVGEDFGNQHALARVDPQFLGLFGTDLFDPHSEVSPLDRSLLDKLLGDPLGQIGRNGKADALVSAR